MAFVSLSLWTPTYIWDSFRLLDQADSHDSVLGTQTNFVLGSLSLGLINPKLIGARFAQSQGTNIYIGFVSLGLPDLNTIWPAFTFPRPGFSKIYWGLFRSASLHQHKHMYVGFVYVGLLDSNKFWQGFPFAQPGFSNIYWGSFNSAFGHQQTYRVRFPWPARPNWLSSLSFVKPNKFDQGSLSLSMVSQILLAFVSLSLRTPTYI